MTDHERFTEFFNKNALNDEEARLFPCIQTGVLEQLEEKIRLSDIRQRRMLLRIKRLKSVELTTVEKISRSGRGPEGPVDIHEEKRRATLGQIQDIGKALTRLSREHRHLLKLKHEVLRAEPTDDEADVSSFVEVMTKAANKLKWPGSLKEEAGE